MQALANKDGLMLRLIGMASTPESSCICFWAWMLLSHPSSPPPITPVLLPSSLIEAVEACVSTCFRPLHIWCRDKQASQGARDMPCSWPPTIFTGSQLECFITTPLPPAPIFSDQQRGQGGSSGPGQFGASFSTIHSLA